MRTTTALTAATLLLLLVVSLASLAQEERRVLEEWKASEEGKNFRERSEEETRRLFAEWKALHDEKFISPGEEERRYAVFKEDLRRADQHDAPFVPCFVPWTDEEQSAIKKDKNWGYLPAVASRMN